MSLNSLTKNPNRDSENLFSSIRIGGIKLRNRLVMSPMVNNYASLEGGITEEFTNFYLARAKGGVGLIVLGATYVHPDGRGFNNQLGIHRDELIPSLQRFCNQIQSHCKVFVQLSLRFRDRKPKDFSEQEIKKYVSAFAEGAYRAKKAGFNGVELHACHDYFINQFLSPYTNHREDKYGGSLSNRMRVAIKTLQTVRNKVGRNYSVGCRINGDEFVADGLKLDETKQIANNLQNHGADYISVSGGLGVTQYRMSPPMEVPRGSLIHLAEAISESVEVPVIGVGRLDRPVAIREAYSRGVDLVAMGRALLADPEFINKMRKDQEPDIRPCVACNFCLWELHKQKPVQCLVNPYIGKDLLEISQTSDPKQVLVVGGGPAGMEAADTLANRGHNVSLLEKRKKLGGKILLGMRPPHKEPLQDFLNYLEKKLSKCGVEAQLGKEVTPKLIDEHSPEAVVFATGSQPIKPKIKGIDSSHVLLVEDILKDEVVTPNKRYLMVGGGLVGMETAEFIADRDAEVEIIEMKEEVGEELAPIRRKVILKNLEEAGVSISTSVKLSSIEEEWVYVNTSSGQEKKLGPYDFIVLACGYQSDRRLIDKVRELNNHSFRIAEVGDCKEARTIYEAIKEAMEVGLEI